MPSHLNETILQVTQSLFSMPNENVMCGYGRGRGGQETGDKVDQAEALEERQIHHAVSRHAASLQRKRS